MNVTVVERVRFQRRIAEMRARKKPVAWKIIAKQIDHPIRTCQEWHRKWIEQQTYYDDPQGIVGEALDMYSAMMDEAAIEIRDADQTAAKVGALRLLLDLIARRLNLLIQVGRMPRNMGDFETAAEVRKMILRMSEVVERHNLPAEVIDDLLSIVEGAHAPAR